MHPPYSPLLGVGTPNVEISLASEAKVSPTERNSFTLTPFLASTVLIAPAHVGSALRRSAPSTTCTPTIRLLICAAALRGWALRNKPWHLLSATVVNTSSRFLLPF